MRYRHKYFRLDSESKIVLDENDKRLAFTEQLILVLLFLCEHEKAQTDEIGDFIHGFESDRFYNLNSIRQYRYRINKFLGHDVIQYKNQQFFIDGTVEPDEEPVNPKVPAVPDLVPDSVPETETLLVPVTNNRQNDENNRFARNMLIHVVFIVGSCIAILLYVMLTRHPLFPQTWAVLTSEASDMAIIPEGEFLMGSTDSQTLDAYKADNEVYPKERYMAEYPQRKVFVPKFSIDREEVSNDEYAMFAEATDRSLPESLRLQDLNSPNQPIVGIDWNEADAYCAWVGERLPTEAEWEKAARGTDGRLYPWGNTWDNAKDNHGDGKLYGTDSSDGFKYAAPVGTESGVSPYGILNMSGNANEWVSDDFNSYPGNDKYSYALLNKGMKVIKGGAFNNSVSEHRPASRIGFPKDFRNFSYSFRCAKDLQ